MPDAADRGMTRAELLLEVGRSLADAADLDAALDALCGAFVPRFADWCGVYLLEDDGVRFATTRHRDAALAARARDYLARRPIDLRAPVGIGRTLRTGETEVVPDFLVLLDALGLPAEERRELAVFGAKSVLYVALRVQGRIVGAMTAARGADRPAFEHDEARLMEDVAARAATAIENARLVRELRERESRLRAHNDALVRLAQGTLQDTLDFAGAAAAIVETSARTLDVERVSIWLYDDARTRIQCLDLYEATPHRHTSGLELAASDHPAYFAALAEERTIDADDARTDPRTSEFAESYLKPLGITSMLDAPLRVGGRVVGVLCHEHVGPARHWRAEESLFAGALADLVSRVLEAQDRQRARGMLAESEVRFTRLADDAPIGIWLTDARLRNVFNNRWRRELLGCSDEELHGDGWLQRVHPDDVATEFARIRPQLRAHEPITTQHRLRAADGSWRHVINVANPRFGSDGRFLGYLGAEFDVTDRLEAQTKLAQARRELAQSEKLAAMGSLVSGVAHEVRTPLAYMANHAALLLHQLERAQAGSPEQRAMAASMRESVDAIQEGIERVNLLVGDLRRFVRSERNARERVALRDVVGAAARMFEATHRGGALVALELADAGDVRADRSQVQQVVLNLLENAADASPPGSTVRVTTRRGARGPEVVVSDEGPGIPPDVQARMFEPFFTTKPQGTGLGLSIVRRILESHGGRIECHSAPGKGSTFIVSLPAAPADEAAAP